MRRTGLFVGLISIVLIATAAVAGATTRVPVPSTQTYSAANLTPVPQQINIGAPRVSDVKSIQIALGMPTPNEPKPLVPDTSQNKAIVAKVLSWVATAKPVGYEKPQPMPNIGPTALDIWLKNGKEIQFLPALDSVIQRNKSGQIFAIQWHYAVGYVDWNINDTSVSLRVYCPQLYNWLRDGWRQDIVVVQRK